MKDIESFIFDENYFKNKYVSHCVLFNKEENVNWNLSNQNLTRAKFINRLCQ